MKYPLDWKLISALFRMFTKEYEGLENIESNRPYIFAANHIGLIDSPFIASVLMKKLDHRIHFFAKEELIRQYGKLVTKKLLRFIPVHRNEPSKSILEAGDWLKHGESVAIFPEGRRNASKELSRGKTGVARLALKSQIPVIPIGYQGPIPTRLQENLFYDLKELFKIHAPVIIKIGQPIDLQKYYRQPETKELLQEVTDLIMEKISILCGKPYNHGKPN